jgi:RNA polymerase sigma factor (sigma-70 family)
MRPQLLRPLLNSLYRSCARQECEAAPDADLLQRFAQSADQEAFAALVRRHGAMVLGICQRVLPDRHEAEDAFQATFLVLVRKSAGLRQPQQLAAWLHGVARRIAVRLRHRAVRWQALPEDFDAAAPQGPEPLERLAWLELRTILDEEIERLPSRYRLPVILCYLQGQSYAEAARTLGWPAGTVSVRLARSRQLLRARLARRGLGLAAALLASLPGPRLLASLVPPALLTATLKAGSYGAGRQAALAGVVSQRVLTLSEGALRAMWMTKCKSAVLVLLLTGLAWSGLGGLPWRQAQQAQAQASPGIEAQEPKEAQPGAEPSPDKRLVELERHLKALREKLDEKQRQLDSLRQGDALLQIEAALQTLKDANAGEPQRRAAVEEFEQAFVRMKRALVAPDLSSLAREMEAIKDRLGMAAAGKKTQKMQQDLLDHLDTIIKEGETKLKDREDAKLSERLAELKLIRSMQKRVNVRTEVFGKEYQGEQVPPPDTAKGAAEKELFETLRRELKEISIRQEQIHKITQELGKTAGK